MRVSKAESIIIIIITVRIHLLSNCETEEGRGGQ